ncbi:ABC transporter permease [Cystobacter fuscus]
MNGLKETAVIWSAECQRTLRSTRVLALLGLYSLFSLLVFVVAAFLRSFVQQMTQSGMMTVPSEGIPLAVVVVFFFSLFFLPLYVALMGFDQVSGEVGPRSIRYLTVRAPLVGAVGQAAGAGHGAAEPRVRARPGAVRVRLGQHAGLRPADFGGSLLRFWLASAVFSFAFLSLTSLCSCVTTSPPVSLILNLAVLMFSAVLWMTALADEDNPVRYLRFLSPLKYALELLDPALRTAAISMAAYAAFTLLFLGSALTALRTRDL